MSSSTLTPMQRYAAGALFGLALHQAQIHQTCPLGFPSDEDNNERISNSSSNDSVSDDPHLWVHQSSGLLRPVFKFLEIDEKAWSGLEETAGLSSPKHHVGAFLRSLSVSEEGADASSEAAEKELYLAKAIDAMASSMERASHDVSKKEKQREYEDKCREKLSLADTQSRSEVENTTNIENYQEKSKKSSSIEQAHLESVSGFDKKPVEEASTLEYSRKVTVLYQLFSACLSQSPEESKKYTRRRRGYDARHRVALHLLATWFDIKWIKVEAIETTIACSAMALKEEELKEQSRSPKSSWAKWKRRGIIGAAAVTGGTLLAVTGGLAAPAIAAGFGALVPTLGTLVPVIGASGFAAVAGAAGSVAGSVAVAASFGAAGAGLTGFKMARRTGDVDEFEFKALGENHNQGRLAVEVLISGLVFKEEDFVRPWEGQHDNSERYVLQWESKNLIAVSTAIQDWLTSRLAMELMKRGAMMTVLKTLLAALALPATLLAMTDFIDSKWAVAVDRSDKAGKLLAEVLQKGFQGHRPVTLVGFSLGARVIFKCLQILAESENNSGLVERVFLLGAPIAIKNMNWEAARKVVAGRFVNAYATNDWMLGIAFRARAKERGKQMPEKNDTIGKGNSCCVDGNSKTVNPIKEAGARGTGSGEGVSSSATSSSSKNQGKSCKGCLYYSSTFKSNSRNPLCLGLSRSLPQVPRYIVGESEKEASKEGRSLTDFRYACVGYSVYLDQKSRSTDAQEAQTELPVCVGLEVLVDKRPSSADAAPGHAHAHARNREDGHGLPQPRSNKPANSGGDEFFTRFTRNANLVAMGVAKNLRKVGNRIKESVDDIFDRRPK